MEIYSLLSPKNIVLFLVIFTRINGMIVSAPLISTFPIPIQVKIWFTATVAFLIYPIVAIKANFVMPTNMPELTVIMLREFIIGYTIGFVANLIFVGTEICANLISMQMGLTAAQAMNPMTGDQSSVLTQVYTVIASLVFIGMHAFQYLFGAVFKSFQVMPPAYSWAVHGQMTNNFAHLTSQMFTIGLSIALPIFGVLFMTDVLLGFTAKMMPKMNIFMVALPLKIATGLIILMILVPQLFNYMAELFEKYLKEALIIVGG